MNPIKGPNKYKVFHMLINKTPKFHDLKIHCKFFTSLKNGTKTSEVRFNDRDFKVDDILVLRDFVPKAYFEPEEQAYFTGEYVIRRVTHVLKGGEYGIGNGYVVLSLSDKLI